MQAGDSNHPAVIAVHREISIRSAKASGPEVDGCVEVKAKRNCDFFKHILVYSNPMLLPLQALCKKWIYK
jgi:hypothetical protein